MKFLNLKLAIKLIILLSIIITVLPVLSNAFQVNINEQLLNDMEAVLERRKLFIFTFRQPRITR